MQNYTYFEQNSKTFFKKCIFTAIIDILQYPFPPPEAKIAFPPPLSEKSESPPCRPILYLPPAANHRAQVWQWVHSVLVNLRVEGPSNSALR